jgi:hypothetical protein
MTLPIIDQTALTPAQRDEWTKLIYAETFHRHAHEDVVNKLKAIAATVALNSTLQADGPEENFVPEPPARIPVPEDERKRIEASQPTRDRGTPFVADIYKKKE